MKPTKILYVDDEAMALKYFERLVSPMAPVLTATSVEAGRALGSRERADRPHRVNLDIECPGQKDGL